jgi:integrase
MPVKPEKRQGRKTGRWVADIQDSRSGIQRTRRTFDTKKEAEAWAASVRQEGQDLLLGKRKRRTFGEALTRYLAEVVPQKKSADTETHHHIVTLRWPFLHEGRWIWLEHVPLEAPPGQLSIVTAMASWRADLLGVLRRSYLGSEHYQYRRGPKGEAWYHQPKAEGDRPPAPRQLVTDPALLDRLNQAKGAGPYRPDTLRIRQSIVKAVLKHCWRWDWIGADIGSKITAERPAPGRELYATRAQRFRLLRAAAKSDYGAHLAHAIWAGSILGWRRANLLGLAWENVHWPVRDAKGHEIQMGYLIAWPDQTKTGRAITAPIGPALERLLLRRLALKQGELVFHRGDGQALDNFRKTWKTCCRAAGLPEDFRWHDLRHTWASLMVQAGADERTLMELGGWTTPAMPRRYAHLRLEHLRHKAELAANPNGRKDK